MGPNYKHDRLSGNFVNLTDTTVNIYEARSGQIWKFPPSSDPLPEVPHFKPDQPLLHYIVEPAVAEDIKASGRSLEDIAIVCNKMIGRHGTEITYLQWGYNPDIKVRLYRGFRKNPRPLHKTHKKSSKRH